MSDSRLGIFISLDVNGKHRTQPPNVESFLIFPSMARLFYVEYRLTMGSLVCRKDNEIRFKSEKFRANQLKFALSNSIAGKQALEILIRDCMHEVCEERKLHADDTKSRLLISMEVKETVEKDAEKRVAEIAKVLEEDGFGVWEGDQIGACLFNEVKLETGYGGYTTLRMVELREILRLRELDVEGSRKELLKRLSDWDAENVPEKPVRSHVGC